MKKKKYKIFNVTNKPATKWQQYEGVEDLPPVYFDKVCELLQFDDCVNLSTERTRRVAALVEIVKELKKGVGGEEAYYMIDAPSFFIYELVQALTEAGISPIFALTKEVTRESRCFDGSYELHKEQYHLAFVGLQGSDIPFIW